MSLSLRLNLMKVFSNKMQFIVCLFLLTFNIIQEVDSHQENSVNKRGVNYLRLINNVTHVLFEPDYYSRWDLDTAFKQMNAYEYSYVRVFLDCPYLFTGFNRSSPGVPMNFTKNIVDFINRARNYNLSVMLTASFNPRNYQSIIDSYPKPANVTGKNLVIFHRGQIAAKIAFLKDLLQQIQTTSLSALQNIFAFDVFNEICVLVDEQPFSLTSGFVLFENQTFDMSKGIDRQRLLDLATNIWFNSIIKSIKSYLPNLLVSASLFSPNAVGHQGFDGVQIRPSNKDQRYPLRPASLINASADYVDLHVYATNNSINEMKGAELSRDKPILMGEVGAARARFVNATFAALAIQSVINASIDFGFVGWGIWNFDTIEQHTRWTLTEQNNTMNNILAPSVWPIPNV